MLLNIDKIKIPPRHRQDMGDLALLAKSIEEQGLLQPIGVSKEHVLVFGERRLRAVRGILGWTTIETRIVNVTSIVEGECAENAIRKDFTVSERVAIGRSIEIATGERRGRPCAEISRNCGEISPGTRTDDFAARRAGFNSADTYRRAKAVIDNGVPGLVAVVDTGQVSISAAAVVATLTPEEQRAVVAGGEQEISRVAAEIRTRKAEERRQVRTNPFALPIHPAGNAFPMMKKKEMAGLVRDIKAHGLMQPIVLYEGAVLDGKCRLRACELAGVEPRFVEWTCEEGDNPWKYVWSMNGLRMDLNPGQREIVEIWLREHEESNARTGHV